MNRVIAFIPNLLTLSNLTAGCLAILAALSGSNEMVFWLVIAAAVFDFFDGFVARLLHVSSPVGKELDSLADMVSFGVVPSMVMFLLMRSAGLECWSFLAFLIAACSALRLAKFNLDERQSEEFRGLATPANTLFFVALALPFWGWAQQGWLLITLTVVFSALLVSDIPMFALKFKSFGLKENALRYVFLLISLGLVVWLGMASPVVIILCYIVMSVIRAFVMRRP